MNLSAEALIEGDEQRTAAIVFGPENGAVAEKLVFEAAREAYAKGYGQLYVVGFAVQPDARRLIENCERTGRSTRDLYPGPSMDLLMGDLLKNLRSSQIFSVCGLPDVRIERTVDQDYRVELLGLDVFDPVEMDVRAPGRRQPSSAWFLDTGAMKPGSLVEAYRAIVRGVHDHGMHRHEFAGNLDLQVDEAGCERRRHLNRRVCSTPIGVLMAIDTLAFKGLRFQRTEQQARV